MAVRRSNHKLIESSSDQLCQTGPHACVQCSHSLIEDIIPFTSFGELEALYRSNNPPTPNDLHVLRKEYESVAESTSQLDSQLAQLQARVESQRRELAEHSLVYKSVLSPLRLFPNELLAQIFGLCVDGARVMESPSEDTNFPSTLDTGKGPWVLSQVCRRWREVALSLPALWVTIGIDWEGQAREVLHPYIKRRLELALERARNRRLSVSWHQGSCQDEDIVSILCSRSSRWKDLSLRVGIEGLSLLARFGGSLRNLSTLSLDFEEDDWPDEEDDSLFSIFRGAPALCDLTLAGDLQPVLPLLVPYVPWKQLTDFALKACNQAEVDIQLIMPLLTNVENCHLEHVFNSQPITPVVLAHLRTLYVRVILQATVLLNTLTCPALGILFFITRTPVMEPIIQFLQRSSCRLEYLTLLYADPDDLVRLIQIPELQNLRHLHVSGPPINTPPYVQSVSNTVLNALRWETSTSADDTSHNGVVLPHLARLALFGVKQWSDPVLVGMLNSRRNVDESLSRGTSPLIMVRFERMNATESPEVVFEDEDALMQMDALVESGLRVLSLTGSVSFNLA
ncbi:hypothetical protein PQX77_005585 [Marasmius sp. AFHP31]|nr:hypothetical protein PQX77_005585 [Marasmius sp. AFHP31]